MHSRTTTFLVLAGSLGFSACGGGGGNSPTPTTPTPPTTPNTPSFTLSGRVTESAPTTFITVTGATVSVGDGPNAGKSTTTDGNGNYQLSGLQQSGFTVNVTASGYAGTSAGINLTSNLTRNFTLDPSGPRTAFGPGQHRVGSTIASGRYFSDPNSGCYWERQSGFGGTLNDVIANDFISYNALQYIVDILPSDAAFDGDSECGNWYNTPRHPAQSSIPPGVWLVGSQLAPGTYQVNAGAGCYWERLRHFTHRGVDGVIANDFIAGGGSRIVTIDAGDAGFLNDGDCGTWSRSFALDSAATSDAPQTREEIERNRASYQRRNAGRR